MSPRRLAGLAAATLVAFAADVPAADPPAPAEIEFFEANVRPILVARCQECHGAAKQQGQVRLDSREALTADGPAGKIVVPGDPAGSRLTQVLAHDPLDTQMPPTGKLPPAEIAVLTEWIARGAVWPAGDAVASASPTADATAHWAFQPVVKTPPPEVGHAEGARTPIDRFLLSRLEAAGLDFAPPADRRTLLRRVHLDLTGLPPTAEQVAAFEADAAPDAYERAVDRLLASPLHGQRWARHWLDLARYADTKGYVFVEDINYPYAYTYRDYVVAAFNADKPFDRFVLEQLAADRLGLPGDAPELAAMGYLTLGRRFLKNGHDIIDDRIDVTTRGLMGLTVTCARCHDHKFDPIPTADYYSLYGVFDSSFEPADGDLPEIGTPTESAAFAAYREELAKREAAVAAYVAERRPALEREMRTNSEMYLRDALGLPVSGEMRDRAKKFWQERIEAAGDADPVWGPWRRLRGLGDDGFEAAASNVLEAVATEPAFGSGVGLLVVEALRAEPPKDKTQLAHSYARLLASAVERPADVDPASSARLDELNALLAASGTPFALNDEQAEQLFNRAERTAKKDRERHIDELRASSPAAPPRAMVLRDQPSPHEVGIFIRGQPGRRGEIAPRRFLKCLSDGERPAFTDGSGRLELARRIADPANPLTARVLVNRVWMHHFGEGLVRTPSDFGTRADPPTHPQLLDWLAADFVEHGWSIKRLHRTILFSSAYRQSSNTAPESRNAESLGAASGPSQADPHLVDPENKLLWKFPRRRLDFEAMRDSALAAAGRLDPQLSGKAVDIVEGDTPRRTVYAYINRNDRAGVMRAFDMANPDVSTPQRSATTVPQQALFGMNSPFMQRQAKALAARPDVAAAEPSETVRRLYAIALQREPSVEERNAAVGFLTAPQAEGAGLTPTEELAQILLLTNEFNFLE